MITGVLKEERPAGARVAVTPETVRRLTGSGCDGLIEAGAGERAARSGQVPADTLDGFVAGTVLPLGGPASP